MFMRIVAITTAVTFAMPAWAQDSDTDVLFELLKLPDVIEVMREEGIGYGETIGEDLFAGPASADWIAQVDRIYNYDVMEALVREDFEASLGDTDLAPIIAFFETEQGQQFVNLEVSARRAMLDDAVEDASKEAAADAAADEDPRLLLVGEFVEINNLIETNVAGSLNSNLAFYMGLLDGGAFDGALSEDQILVDVWSQEAEIRENTSEWIYSFLYLAYQPVEDVDLQAYITFSETEAGGALNRAMFESFDRLFEGISRSLGRAAANEMTSQEL